MGSDSIDSLFPIDTPTYDINLGEVFMEQLPYYLSIGMTNDEYWRGDNKLPRLFKKAQDLRERRANNHAHIAGMYSRLAYASVQSNKVQYPDEPFPLTKEDEQAQRTRALRRKAEAWKRKVETETATLKG